MTDREDQTNYLLGKFIGLFPELTGIDVVHHDDVETIEVTIHLASKPSMLFTMEIESDDDRYDFVGQGVSITFPFEPERLCERHGKPIAWEHAVGCVKCCAEAEADAIASGQGPCEGAILGDQ